MTKSRILSAALALALTVSIVPATMAQDDALEDDPAVETLLEGEIEIGAADIQSLDLLLTELESNIAANTAALDVLADDILPAADERISKMQNRTDQVPQLRERLKANNQVTKAAVKAITQLQGQVKAVNDRLTETRLDVRDMRANINGINAALQRMGESGCTGPTCTD